MNARYVIFCVKTLKKINKTHRVTSLNFVSIIS